MLISDSRRFVFVHVSKSAGSSVVHVLQPHALPRPPPGILSLLRVLDLPRDYRSFRFGQHATLREVQRHMPPDRFAGYFKFAFVRNPWDRLVSEYNALLHKPYNRRHERVKRMGFKGYLRREAPRIVRPQAELLADRTGRLGLDFVGRFENFSEDLRTICRRLGLPEPAAVPHTNRFGHGAYREYYDAEDAALVAHRYAADVDQFGYEF